MHPQICLFSSVCSATFPQEILKDKSGFIFFSALFPHCHNHWEQSTSQTASAEALGRPLDPISRSSSQSLQPSQLEKADITTCSELLRAGWKYNCVPLPFFLTITPKAGVQLCGQREINPHPNDLVTQMLSHRDLKRGISLVVSGQPQHFTRQ